ncbi:MAG: NAD(P)-dependent glycerol-3-phosphate dehydrogenase [Armatimonadetes bacterium]|nr:NAD(P)-dependent glycerol-3-phosphate dehydrogenase [Armatimonadota bacterium]
MTESREPIAIIGAGSWGTALSLVLGRAGRTVHLWARREKLTEEISRNRHNPDYLAEYELPDSVTASAELDAAVDAAPLVILAVPSQGMGEIAARLASVLTEHTRAVVSAAKGLDPASGSRLSMIVSERLGPAWSARLAVLSGPNLAPEVAAGHATVSVAASDSAECAAEVQAALSTSRFRVYTNPDVLGVELGGVLKNIIAIGAGISDGLGFGDNTKAALITRGLAEITRLGVALGAKADTFKGLSGMGDLVATCASQKSRNHRVGYELARGKSLASIVAEMAPQVAEGVETARTALRLAESAKVEMPIAAAVQAVMFEGVAPEEAVQTLMTRAWRDELDG